MLHSFDLSTSPTSYPSRWTSHKALPELAKEEDITNRMVSRSYLTNHKILSSKPMNLTTTADSVMMFCIIASMAIFDAFSTLLSILKKGIFVDQKSVLMQKSNSELRAMLVGIDKISKLNKKQLVDLVLDKSVIHSYGWICLILQLRQLKLSNTHPTHTAILSAIKSYKNLSTSFLN